MRKVPPFNEPARELSVLTKLLWLHQRDILSRYTTKEREVETLLEIGQDREETLAYRDNLYLDEVFIDEAVKRSKDSGRACRVAFELDDPAICGQALCLQCGIRQQGRYHVADLWYYPNGIEPVVCPMVMCTEPREGGFCHVPTHISDQHGDLVYDLPAKSFLSTEQWSHVLHANIDFGIFAIGDWGRCCPNLPSILRTGSGHRCRSLTQPARGRQAAGNEIEGRLIAVPYTAQRMLALRPA